MISRYKRENYAEVKALIELCGLPIFSADELEGYALTWRDKGKVVGFLWALVGEGATVYLDLFCVDPAYRGSDNRDEATGRSKIAVMLMLKLLTDMKALGKTKLLGTLPKGPLSESLERIYHSFGMKFAEAHSMLHGNIDEVLNTLGKKSGMPAIMPENCIDGLVEKGLQRAGKSDFPTANVKTTISDGVYVGKTQFGDCLAVVGNGLAEVHIIGYEGNLYDQILMVNGLKRVPDELVKNYMEFYFGGHDEQHNYAKN
jgi:hypothetical protein